MNNILQDFLKEMELLKHYVEFQNTSYKNQAKIERGNPDSILQTLTISKIKQFDLNSHIISVYGAYENFIELLFTKYLREMCTIISSYDKLPEEIQKNNLNKTIEIIKQIDFRKNRNVKPEKLIEILHKNINENSSALNFDAFKNHNANFRISTVDSYFNEIGIKNISSLIRQYEPLRTYLEQNILDYPSKKNNIVFQVLEHICDLRNDIAHGVTNIQLINKSILFEYIEYMKLFASSLYELVNSYYLSKVFDFCNEEIQVLNIFNHEILCFNTRGRALNRNSKILVKADNQFPSTFFIGIIDIQHNKSSISHTELNQNLDIGIQVDKKIKDTMKFKLILE